MKRQPKERRATEPGASPALAAERRELVAIAAIAAVGVVLRILAAAHAAVEHFDEGVYASNLYFGPPDYAYPMQPMYAPPLLPALIEAGMIAGLAPNFAAILPSLIAGVVTIVVLWRVGRWWFGPPAGIAAATLAALSPFHIAYSAAALTDGLLGLWLLLAVHAIGRSLVGGVSRPLKMGTGSDPTRRIAAQSGRWEVPVPHFQHSARPQPSDGTQSVSATWLWAVAGGAFTGLAWWTKYNGWLPLAIAAAALPVLWLVLRPTQRQLLTWLGCLAVTALVAALVWSPYYLWLQSHGGYGPIAANHAKYVVGFAGWLGSAAQQLAKLSVMDGSGGGIAVAFACLLPGLVDQRGRRSVWVQVVLAGTLGAAAIMGTSLTATLVGSLVALARFAYVSLTAKSQINSPVKQVIGVALCAAWLSGLLVATPCYTPYPRLMLPLMIVSWLGLALNFSAKTKDAAEPQREGAFHAPYVVLIVVALIAGLAIRGTIGASLQVRKLPTDRRGILEIAKEVHALNGSQNPRVMYVFGEPALFFQLRAAGEEIVAPVQEVPLTPATNLGEPLPTFLLVGPHTDRDPTFSKQWPSASQHWKLIESYPYQPSAIVWLDAHDPREAKEKESSVRLYQFTQ